MGCGGSKVDDLRLVALCKERKEFVKAASDYRYTLAAAHVSYFTSLKDVGEALRIFVDEEIVIGASPSPSDSPVLTLPSDKGKKKNNKGSSSSTSISHSGSVSQLHSPEEVELEEGSHLHLSSDSDFELDSSPGHIHIQESPKKEEVPYYPPYNPYQQPNFWGPPGMNYNAYYMKRAPTTPTTVYEDPHGSSSTGYWQDSSNMYSGYPQYGNGGFFGFSMDSSTPQESNYSRPPNPPTPPPAPPTPEVSSWDYINIFDTWEHTNPGYYSRSRYGSTSSSPDSKEIREREGIPDLEDETESEMNKEADKGKKVREHVKFKLGVGASRAVPSQDDDTTSRYTPSRFSEGTGMTKAPQHNEGSSRGIPPLHNEGPLKVVPSQNSEGMQSALEKEIKRSPDTIESKSTEEVYLRKKEVTFDVDDSSSMPSTLTALSTHGTRDLQEVVKEIRNEFEMASKNGREVAVLLEVGKFPYQSKGAVFKLLISRILYSVASSKSSSHSPTEQSIQMASRTREMAKAYYRDLGKDTNINVKPTKISSVLDELYTWEKKLCKEVKNEERLRLIYEKECKKLKILDVRGAESSKIDAARASIRRLLTKIDIHIRTIEAISRRINILRDKELQPQLKILIDGLVRMWRSTLMCHQKQVQAILESKTRTLKAKTGLRKDSSLWATVRLEEELLNWCTHFSSWINAQKSYVMSLNEWLMRCLSHEQEESLDGPIPFSPGRIGAPPIFVACNDWFQAMKRISESGVTNSMHDFALNLHELWEKQDEEQKQRIKSDYLVKDFEKRFRTYRMERGKMEQDLDALSEKAAGSRVLSESGISPLDDLKVDLDSMRKRLVEERARHKEAIKQVHSAATNSIQAGLVPIFETLSNFTSEALKAHEQVRTQYVENAGGS